MLSENNISTNKIRHKSELIICQNNDNNNSNNSMRIGN